MLREPLFSRRSAIVSGIIILLIFIGCMSMGETTRVDVLSPEAPETANPNLIADGMLEQEGKISIYGTSEQDLYYPVPFIGPPNLVLEGDTDYLKIVSQRRDHFRVRNVAENKHYLGTVHWKARGIKATLVTTSSPVPPPTVTTAKTLPSEPIPAGTQP